MIDGDCRAPLAGPNEAITPLVTATPHPEPTPCPAAYRDVCLCSGRDLHCRTDFDVSTNFPSRIHTLLLLHTYII